MRKITFIAPDGSQQVVEGEDSQSVMEIATRNGVPGIFADCGGACACATCHVYVAQEWLAKMSPVDATEEAMLEFAENATPASRLSCQIRLTPELDGLSVIIPEY